MEIIPAIDLIGGKCVRLTRGDYALVREYSDDPVAVAAAFRDQGAARLHVIDLDGARTGEPANLGLAAEIRRRSGLPVEFGGGIRSVAAIRMALDAGMDRVILGTAVFSGRDFLAQAVAIGAGYIIVSADVRGGKAAILGWNQASIHDAADIPGFLRAGGVKEAIHTDVERDGTLSGIDAVAVAAVIAGYRAAGMRVQYAGGIGGISDIRALAGLGTGAPDAVVVGKALYEGAFTFAAAVKAAVAPKG